MPVDEDKYPAESGRRRFVKGVVGSAALSSVGAGGAAALDTVTQEAGSGGGQTQYVAIENTAGPAPRGMPLIPLEIQDGELYGVWPEYNSEQDLAVAEDFGGSGITYSSAWFQYCGLQSAQGVDPQADANNAFISSPSYTWQEEQESGVPLQVSWFDDYESWGNGIGTDGVGKPATANWRSEEASTKITVQVLRSPRVTQMANGEGPFSDLPGQVQQFIDAATAQDFMAWTNKCTHFCCVPGWKTNEGAENYDAGDDVYCQCHQSVYDPFSPVLKTFTALPRPN
ncbi:ubiquinol-cytochrome c reductase iron-sulfur subunit [Halomicrobium urmianum]|uniref:ubiquinol-cytochrome c reductase iron-sulfur subunit n=1 Tax=Halomicrobium urmianum TaxID=1586233 RepID=UPI001CD924A7|nr:ubiquinol-cytochrome c reductase iron-sulfur subunit [Halomicrobium urmianum]